jgi:hypothetical protein
VATLSDFLRPLLLASIVAGTGACSGHPSDEQMIEEFERNPQAYTSLAEMAREDSKFSRISYEFVHPNWSLAEDEQLSSIEEPSWNEYRQRFDDLHLASGVTIYDHGVIELIRSSTGLVTSGSSKGFLNAGELPDDIRLISEDEPLACEPGSSGTCYVAKRIAPDWFLVLERH